MIVADQMQRAMHHHVRPVRLQGFAVAYRLAPDHFRADHEVAERQRHICRFAARGEPWRRKRQHIGGLVLAAPQLVQLAALARRDHADRELAAFAAFSQGRGRPGVHARAWWSPGTRAASEIEFQRPRRTHSLSGGVCASYAFTIRCTSGWRTTSAASKNVNATPSVWRRMLMTCRRPDILP